MMCPNTVECVKMQCTREYIGDEREARATDLCKMTIDERKNIPLNENLLRERFLVLGI